MTKTGILFAIGILVAGLPATMTRAETGGHITGLGGVFVTSKDP